MKKKILAAVLAGTMVFSMTACGSKKAETEAKATETQAAAETEAETKATEAETKATEAETEAETKATEAESETSSAAPAETETTTAANGDYKIAMVTDSGDITDQSFNQTTYEACKAFAEANGIDFNYYKPEGDSDEARIASVDQAVAEGYNVIVLPGYLFGPTVREESLAYPDVKFIALDMSEFDLRGDDMDSDLADVYNTENTYCAIYQEELPGYMAGYAAVKMGYKHLGFLGGMSVPAVIRYGFGYVQGADAAAKELGIEGEVTVEYAYGGQFYGDADITAAMDTWYSTNGVEVVFACGGGIYTSAAEAAAKVGGKVIGVDSDQAPIIDQYGEGMTITSAMKGLAPTVNTLLTAIAVDDTWADYVGKIDNLGLVSENPEENYVQLPMETTQWTDSFTQDDYKALVAAMLSGEVTVDNNIETMPETTITVNDLGSIKS